MQSTRKIDVADRVFTISDLLRFARILDEQALNGCESGFQAEYAVRFEDGLSIEGTASEVFSKEQLNRPSRPSTVEMRLRGGNRYIRIDISAGNATYRNAIVIGSDDAKWMNSNVTALRDALEKVLPQSNWWSRHPVLLLNIVALALGTTFDTVIFLGVLILRKGFPNVSHGVDQFLWPAPTWLIWLSLFYSSFLGRSIFRWLLGLGLAFRLRSWLLSAWPKIEFDFGSPYLRPTNKRRRLGTIWTLVVVPLLVAALYDLLKLVMHV